MFDIEVFVDECKTALNQSQPMLAIKDILERAVAAPADVSNGVKAESGVELLYRSDDLTIVSVVVPPGLPKTLPHDHRMWALVGIYGGQEDNQFFRRENGTLVTSGGRSIHTADTLAMGDDTIHSICNPLEHSALAAIHVYGGDLVAAERSMWTKPGFTEAPYDDKKVVGGAGIRGVN